MLLPGYHVVETLDETAGSIVYRAVRQSDGLEVALKLLNQSYPSPARIEQFQNEFRLARLIDAGPGGVAPSGGEGTIAGTVWSELASAIQGGVARVYDAIEYQRRWFIVMELCAGKPLRTLLQDEVLSLPEVLAIGVEVSAVLARVHDAGIVHKDVNPSNLIYDRQSGQLRLIDFGIASLATREATAFYGASGVVGSPPYLSPEQTGRMNRSIDYRSDFYSFGVTLYELLTGSRPFQGQDLLELVHCHIAKEPIAPHIACPTVPLEVSQIVLKLMAKNAEGRYQSVQWLRAALQSALDVARGVETPGSTSRVGRDVRARLQIPEKLFGRSGELAWLHAAFGRVRGGGTQLLLISGPAGIGKTQLIKELHRPITEQRGNFAEGKFQLLERNVPYAAFVEAFRQFANHLLTLTEVSLGVWRRRILEAVKSNAAIVIDWVPEFEAVLGAQPGVPALPPAETRNRVKVVLQSLVRACASREHPLVLFLDDLQWADAATFELLEAVVAVDESGHLLLVGAYRDNEVDTEHGLARMLERLVALGAPVQCRGLPSLAVEHVQELVSETLSFERADSLQLALLLHTKTGGNPFFVGEYLRLFDDEGVLTFDARQGWSWDPAHARLEHLSDRLADLVAQRLARLPASARALLHLAACVGSRFDVRFLAELGHTTVEHIKHSLAEAQQEDIVEPVAAIATPATRHDTAASVTTYRFLHDHIRAAAYASSAGEQRRARHLEIAQAKSSAGAAERGTEALLDLLQHINICGTEGLGRVECERAAALNLRAAHAARASAAFEQYLNHALHGRSFLRAAGALDSADAWTSHYELSYALFVEAAQAAYLNLKYELMDELLEEVLAHARDVLDVVRAHEICALANISRGRLREGIETGLMALGLLGVRFPERPTQKHVALSYLATRFVLVGRSPENLRQLPPTRSPELLAVFRILRGISAATYLARPELFPLTVLKQVQLSARHGNAAESALAYCSFGLVLGGVMGNFELGTRFGKLALGVVEDFDSKELYPRVHFLHNYFIRPWSEPFRDVLGSMLDAHEVAISVGDFEFAGYLLDLHLACSYHCGVSLAELDLVAAKRVGRLNELGQERTLRIVRTRWQAIRAFREPSFEPWTMNGSVCDCEAIQASMEASGDAHGARDMLVNRLIVSYHFYRFDEAQACLPGIEKEFHSLVGESLVPLYYFYAGLLHFARLQDAAPEERRASLRQIRRCRASLRKWAKAAPGNYGHKLRLLDALWAEHERRFDVARELFDQAIELAEKNGYLRELGLANEHAAAFSLRMRRDNMALHYLRDALYAFELWGAEARIDALVARYPQLAVARARDPGGTVRVTTKNGTGAALDSLSVVKSSQAISSEIRLDLLLTNLMRIMIENAGARCGALLLRKRGAWFIEAEGSAEHSNVTVLESIPIDDQGASPRVPEQLVHYVIRTRSAVVAGEAANAEQFATDPYVIEHRPASMLCLPLLRQGELAGVLYLENGITLNAFTQERVAVLNVLSVQAAIAVQNARLFADLRSLTEAQGRFVPYQFLQIMNRRDIGDVQVGDYVARTMSVLFCDLRQFTSLAERLSPKVTIELLNLYFEAMEAPIGKHGGFIDAFTGDEIMVLFDGDADAAVAAAIDMVAALEALNLRIAASHGVQLQMGVGINTGELLLGTVGGRDRIKCGVVGDTVNLASRIESLTKVYEAKILIGERTHESLVAPECFRIQPMEKVRARGKSESVMLFQVLGRSERGSFKSGIESYG